MEPRPTSGPARRPSVARETAADLADDIKGLVNVAAVPLVDHVQASVALWVLAVMFVPVGLLLLILSAVVLMALSTIIGTPSGTAGSAFMIAWLGLTLAAMFVTFRWLFRRLPRRVLAIAGSGQGRDTRSVTTLAAADSQGRPIQDEPEPHPDEAPVASLAELDARLAPRDP